MSKTNRPSAPMRKGPMGGHRGPGRPVEKAKNFKGTMKQLISYMKPYYVKIIISFIFAIFSTIFMVVGPKISGKAITELSTGFIAKVRGSGAINFDRISEILLFLRS